MANKKISELPLISALSGSQNGGSFIPVVVGGTTTQISAENFSKFMNAYAAQTGSANTFTANQTINANLSVSGTTTLTGNTAIAGNTTIGGTLVVAGRLTAEEFHTEITTASVIYSSGSTKFGDDTGDTHQFTGSINVSGSFIYNGVVVTNVDANTINRLQQTTASLQAFSSSVDNQLAKVYQTTASLNTYTSSNDIWKSGVRNEVSDIEAYTASLKAVAIVSSSTQIQNYDVFALNSNLYNGTGSIKGEISGIEAYTASLKAQAIVSSSTQIQNYDLFALNSNLYTSTGSIKGEIFGIEAYTASLKAAAIVSSSTQVQNYDLFALNSNLYTSTGSLIGITNGLMAYTASNTIWKDGVRSEISGIEAWTASLDNTYATDAQLYQLYQATRSLELHSGSMIGVTNGLMTYTSSNETWKTGVRDEISGIEAWTASLDNTYATDAQLYQLYAATASLNTATGSIKDEIAGIESYTASLKGQAIVSSSTQIQNYDTFALNSNLYTSTGSIKGEIAGIEAYTSSLKGAIVVSGTNVEVLGTLTAQEIYTTYVTSSVLYQSGSTKFGDSVDDTHQITGSLLVSGSSHRIQNGYVILQQVSQSLNFADDTAAAAGGVPLGGLYRSGNFIVIRIV